MDKYAINNLLEKIIKDNIEQQKNVEVGSFLDGLYEGKIRLAESIQELLEHM